MRPGWQRYSGTVDSCQLRKRLPTDPHSQKLIEMDAPAYQPAPDLFFRPPFLDDLDRIAELEVILTTLSLVGAQGACTHV